MTVLNTILDDTSEHYLLSHSQYDNKDIDDVFNSANLFDEPYMQISKLQATALQFFITTANIRTIVEVGTFVGYSAFAMAKAQQDTKCKIITIEQNEKFHAQAEKNRFEHVQSFQKGNKPSIGAIGQIEFVHADAKDHFPTLVPQSSEIDMIFLDGDKEHYSYYFDWAAKHLRNGSYMLIDNALFKGDAVTGTGPNAKGIREATILLKESKLFDYFFLPVGDCMIVARKR